jgi:L-iditol 2-dehydrogenase
MGKNGNKVIIFDHPWIFTVGVLEVKALVKYQKGEGNVEIRDVPEPILPEENWVLIKIKAAGVCGTDIHVWQEKFQNWPPVILGHEFSGEVVKVGGRVRKVKIGDRVVSEPNTGGCGICDYCRSGNMHMCPEKLTLGWRINGAMTDYIAVPDMLLHHIPDNVNFVQAALCEPLAIAVYSVAERGKININDKVLVQGCGPIGILTAYMAKMLGAGKVIITGIDKSEAVRLPAGLKAGADLAVNIQRENLHEIADRVTGGKGVDVLIETSGAPSAISQCTDFVKKQGRIIALGIPAGDITFPWNTAVLKNLDVFFNMSTSYTAWDRALDRLSKDAALLDNLITSVRRLDDWEDAFKSLLDERDIKVVFTFDS